MMTFTNKLDVTGVNTKQTKTILKYILMNKIFHLVI